MYLTTKTYHTVTSNSFQLFDLAPFPEHICSRPYFGAVPILLEQSLFFRFDAVSKSGTKHVLSPNAILLPEFQPRGKEWRYQAFAVWELTCLGSRWFQAAGYRFVY